MRAAGEPQQPAEVLPAATNTYGAQRSLRLRLLTIEVDRRMTEMESVFRRGGDEVRKGEALAVLRRWEVDPMLDSAFRARAKELVWKFQPNGWDEV
jgi:hypothetical protein